MSNVIYLRPRHRDPRAGHVTETIRSRIIRGEFEPGAPLSPTALAVELGVGRTPVREALQRLETEGLVESEPQRGICVFDMTGEEVRELSELREVLEVAATRLAIRRNAGALADALDATVADMQDALRSADVHRYRQLDARFHGLIVEHAGNALLRAAYEAIAFRIQAVRNRLSLDPVLTRASLREHREFARLVRQREIYRASGCLSDHIRWVTGNYLRVAGLVEQ